MTTVWDLHRAVGVAGVDEADAVFVDGVGRVAMVELFEGQDAPVLSADVETVG